MNASMAGMTVKLIMEYPSISYTAYPFEGHSGGSGGGVKPAQVASLSVYEVFVDICMHSRYILEDVIWRLKMPNTDQQVFSFYMQNLALELNY